MKRWLRRGLFLTLSLVIVWLLASVIVALVFTRRVFAPYAEPPPNVEWASFSAHRLHTSDGHEIGAWYHEGQPGQPVIILLHGYHADRSACLGRAHWLAFDGHSLLLLSMRAHGDSTGTRNDIGLSARHDVIAAVDWLEKHKPSKKIYIFGNSMGAAASMFAAKELGNRVAGYIWEAPYRDLHTALHNRTEYHLPPILSQIAYTGLCLAEPVVLAEAKDIAPVRAVQDFPKGPRVLILASREDQRARLAEAEEIQQTVGDQATLVILEHGKHDHLLAADPWRYWDAVRSFLPPPAQRPPPARWRGIDW